LKKAETMAALLARADEALYASKHGGRDRVTYSD
jgi:PleD family two-component response regulator